jgi:hypothetical protein
VAHVSENEKVVDAVIKIKGMLTLQASGSRQFDIYRHIFYNSTSISTHFLGFFTLTKSQVLHCDKSGVAGSANAMLIVPQNSSMLKVVARVSPQDPFT